MMELNGVVVCGYQGIGKSTLAKKSKSFIDLESSSFWVCGSRSPDWFIPYCNIALSLADQGYVVFVSSHEVVRHYLNSCRRELLNVEVIGCVPSLDLKDEWIEKLHQRAVETDLIKDFKAWRNAEDRYRENIQEIMKDFKVCCVIPSMNYSLEGYLYSIFEDNYWKLNL